MENDFKMKAEKSKKVNLSMEVFTFLSCEKIYIKIQLLLIYFSLWTII